MAELLAVERAAGSRGAMLFRPELKAVDCTNARIAYLEGDMTPSEHEAWRTLFTETPEPISTESRREWLGKIRGVSLASDAFFPFQDSINKIAGTGIRAVIQPGGSVRDKEIISACNEHNIAMVFTSQRCFKH